MIEPPPYEIRAECLARWIERNRAALMAVHSDDWDIETVSEAAHICAHAQALATFGVSTGPVYSGRSVSDG